MTTPIENFQDILDAMQRNPQLRDALRRHMLSDELLALPETFAAFVSETRDNFRLVNQRLQPLDTNVAELASGQASMRDDLSRLDINITEIASSQASMGGTLSHLTGRDYESHAARRAPLMATHLLNLPYVSTLSSPRDTQWLDDLALRTLQDGNITHDEALHLQAADLVLETTLKINRTPIMTLDLPEPHAEQEGQDPHQLYLLAEISMTVQERDLVRAVNRAAILQKATGVRTTPLVIGTALENELDKGDTIFLEIPALD